MAKFDISGSSSRQTGLGQQDRNNAIRMEFEPYTKPPEQTARIEPMSEYVKPPAAPEQQAPGGLPLPLQTVEWEGRKDGQGNLAVYKLPSGDMGGNYEVAGINDRYHPEAFKAILRHLSKDCHKHYRRSRRIWRLIAVLVGQPNTYSKD